MYSREAISDNSVILAEQIIAGLTGRRGFDDAWDSCDDDIQQEIIEHIAAEIAESFERMAEIE